MQIEFSNRQSKFPAREWYPLLRQALEAALALAQKDSGQALAHEPAVFVLLAGPLVMRRINREQRGVDRLTDVLSFPQLDFKNGQLLASPAVQDFEIDSRGRKLLPLGDLVLCPAVAERQAAEYGHSLARELAFLAVHGLFHLLGYDHEQPGNEGVVLQLQEQALQSLGLSRRE